MGQIPQKTSAELGFSPNPSVRTGCVRSHLHVSGALPHQASGTVECPLTGNETFHFNSGTRQNPFCSPQGYLGDFTSTAVGEGPTRAMYRPVALHVHTFPESEPIVMQEVTKTAEKRNRWHVKAGVVH
jgi:hypothetical protein